MTRLFLPPLRVQLNVQGSCVRQPQATRKAPQEGQALVEFVILALAILPLFLLIPLIGKYQDLSHATRQASRYVAFDAMARNGSSVSGWKPEDALAQEVITRFFGAPGGAIATSPSGAASGASANPLWVDPFGNALIPDPRQSITVSYGPDAGATHAQGYTAASDGAAFVLHSELDLPTRGIYSGNVSIQLANLPAGLRFTEPFDRINLSMRRSTSLMLEPWNANGPADVESKVKRSAALFPLGQLEALSPVINAPIAAVDVWGGITGPKLGKLDFWSDVVPQDRLQPKLPAKSN